MDYSRLGSIVREARLNKRLTQDEIGDALSLSREQISQIERGRPKKPLDPIHINTFAKVLELSVLDLVIALGYDVRVPGIEDEEQATLLHLYQANRPPVRAAVLGALREALRVQEGGAL